MTDIDDELVQVVPPDDETIWDLLEGLSRRVNRLEHTKSATNLLPMVAIGASAVALGASGFTFISLTKLGKVVVEIAGQTNQIIELLNASNNRSDTPPAKRVNRRPIVDETIPTEVDPVSPGYDPGPRDIPEEVKQALANDNPAELMREPEVGNDDPLTERR